MLGHLIAEHHLGDFYVYLGALLWAIFPIITVLTYSTVAPLPSLALSTFFAALFFGMLITVHHRWRELFNGEAIKDIFYTTIFIGVGFYFFIFMALRHTSAGNVSLLSLLEILFSYLFFNIWKKEEYSAKHILGSLLMMIGGMIVLLPNATTLNIGDILVIPGVMLAPIGNYFQRRARSKVGSETIMFVRSALTVPIVLGLALLIGQTFTLANVSGSLWFLLINGVILLGFSKILWIEAIHRVSITRANALSSISPIFTLLFAYLFLEQYPTLFQLASLIPLIMGLYLLTTPSRIKLNQQSL